MKHFLLPILRRARMIALFVFVAGAVPFACRAGDGDSAVKDPAAVAKPTAPDGDRKPIVFIIKGGADNDKRAVLFAAWDAGLGRPTDIVSSAPLTDNRAAVAKITVGEHAWMSASAHKLTVWARTADQTDKNVRWLFYDIEGWSDTPSSERNNPVKAVENLHEVCVQHGWKLALIPDDPSKFVRYAPHADAIIYQCQKNQDGKRVKMLRALATAIRKANPQCLVGAQLGVGVPSRGYGGTDKAVTFYKATRGFLDLYSVWWGSPESMIELLTKLDSKNPDEPPSARPKQSVQPEPESYQGMPVMNVITTISREYKNKR